MAGWSLAFVWAARAGAEEKPAAQPSDSKALEFFETKVRPLLADNCFECHSSKSKALQGGLRLDSRASMLDGGDSAEAVVVPGKPNESPLVHAIRWETSEMPPRGKLRDEQIAVLVKWIEMGAPWPEGDPTPRRKRATVYDWKALRSRTLGLAADSRRRPAGGQERVAGRRTKSTRSCWRGWKRPGSNRRRRLRLACWCDGSISICSVCRRRPPKSKPSRQSAAKNRSAAIDELVDRLLASPHYGERWARHWLDVARYSEGHGGALDNAVLAGAWRYRDWVVEALNHDLPFDEFIRRQLAGDLIAPEHAVATGFLALGPSYITDGGDPESVAMARAETLDDRVDTVAAGCWA